MATKKPKKKAKEKPPAARDVGVADAVTALLKTKAIQEKASGWLRDVPGFADVVKKLDPDQLASLEDAVEAALVSMRRVVKLPPNLGAQPQEIRISIPEASQAFGIPARTIRDGLIQGLIGGHNFAGRTGWLTTVPEMRGYLRGLENPGLLLKLEARVKELEAECAALKKAKKAA